jgi:diaminopimelate epimerase
MCGNALRCVAKLAWERRRQLLPSASNEGGAGLAGSTDEPVLLVDTPAGKDHVKPRPDTRESVV